MDTHTQSEIFGTPTFERLRTCEPIAPVNLGGPEALACWGFRDRSCPLRKVLEMNWDRLGVTLAGLGGDLGALGVHFGALGKVSGRLGVHPGTLRVDLGAPGMDLGALGMDLGVRKVILLALGVDLGVLGMVLGVCDLTR